MWRTMGYERTVSYLNRTVFLSTMAFGIMNLIITVYAKDLGASMTEIGIVLSMFFITRAVLQIPFGRMSDRYGRRMLIISGTTAYSIAFLLFALSSALSQLVVFRILQGIGSAALWPASEALISDIFPENKRGEAFGRLQSYSMISMAVGGAMGFGILMTTDSIMLTFLFFTVMAFLGVATAYTGVHNTDAPVNLAPPSLPRVSEVSDEPRMFTIVLILLFVSSLAYGLVQPVMIVALQERFNVEIEIIGAAFLAYIAAFSLIQPVTGKLSDKIGRKRPIVVGLLLTSVTMFAMGVITTLLLFVVVLVMSAIADALITPSTSALVSELAKKDCRGQAMGLLGIASDGGLVVGPTLGGIAWDALGQLMPFVLCALVVGITGLFAIVVLDEKVPEKDGHK